MAIKGLAIPVFGDYNFDGNTVFYTNGFIAGKAVEYSVETETSEDNPLWGDDEVAEHDYGVFSGGILTLNTTHLDAFTAKRMLNLKEVQRPVGDAEVTELVYDDDASPKSKGFGIIEMHQVNDVDKYRAVILARVTPKNPSEAATTKGETIEWQTKELECTVERTQEESENYKHPWKYEAWFDTKADAVKYLKTVLNALSRLEVKSAEGTAEGKTQLTVAPALGTGHAYKYSTTGPEPTYMQDLTSWEDWNGKDEIQAAAGKTLYLAEVDSQKKAVKAGSVKVTAKAMAIAKEEK